MTKNNEEILNEIYSGTKKGELMKKKKQRKRNAEYMSAKRSRVDVYDAVKPPK